MLERQPSDSIMMTREQRIACDHKGAGVSLYCSREGYLSFALVTGVENEHSQPDCACRFLCIAFFGHRAWIVRIDKHRNSGGVRHELSQQVEPLGAQAVGDHGCASDVPAWAVQTATFTGSE